MTINWCRYESVNSGRVFTSDYTKHQNFLFPHQAFHDGAWLLLGHFSFVRLSLEMNRHHRGVSCAAWKRVRGRVMSAVGREGPMHPLEALWRQSFKLKFRWNRWKQTLQCFTELKYHGGRHRPALACTDLSLPTCVPKLVMWQRPVLIANIILGWRYCILSWSLESVLSQQQERQKFIVFKKPSSETHSDKIMFYFAKCKERKMAVLISFWLQMSLFLPDSQYHQLFVLEGKHCPGKYCFIYFYPCKPCLDPSLGIHEAGTKFARTIH